jgi:RNA polymerase sigma factor (sigma-70 family)
MPHDVPFDPDNPHDPDYEEAVIEAESNESESDDLEEDADAAVARPLGQRHSALETPVEEIDFDPKLLADSDGDPAIRDRQWSLVHRHFTKRLNDFFAGRVPDPTEREELIAMIWRRALRSFGSLRSPRATWNWLRQIGENALKDRWKSQNAERKNSKKLATYTTVEESLFHEGPTVLESLAQDDAFGDGRWPVDRATLLRRLTELSSEELRYLRLRLIEGLEHEEIAEMLGCSPAAARQRYTRILARVRDA